MHEVILEIVGQKELAKVKFPAVPRQGDLVTYEGESYYVVRVIWDSNTGLVMLIIAKQ